MDTLTSRPSSSAKSRFDLADSSATPLPRAAVQDMHEACVRVGFFYIRNHGVPAAAIDDIFQQAHRFFACPDASAKAIRLTDSPWYRGYLPTGAPGANKVTRNNLLEAFNLARELGPDIRT